MVSMGPDSCREPQVAPTGATITSEYLSTQQLVIEVAQLIAKDSRSAMPYSRDCQCQPNRYKPRAWINFWQSPDRSFQPTASLITQHTTATTLKFRLAQYIFRVRRNILSEMAIESSPSSPGSQRSACSLSPSIRHVWGVAPGSAARPRTHPSGAGGTGARTEDELGRRLRTVIEVCPRIAIVPLGTIPRPEFKASCVRDQRREEQGRGRCAGGPGQLC